MAFIRQRFNSYLLTLADGLWVDHVVLICHILTFFKFLPTTTLNKNDKNFLIKRPNFLIKMKIGFREKIFFFEGEEFLIENFDNNGRC